MILELRELVDHLKTISKSGCAGPSDALWIKFAKEKTKETVEYRSADGNQIVHVYLDDKGALTGIEIFP